ncbi:hypothetical protein D3C83_47720 [compost metagenome]
MQAQPAGPPVLGAERDVGVGCRGRIPTLAVVVDQLAGERRAVALERQRDVALPGRVVLHHVGEELLDREVHRVLQRIVEAGLLGEPTDEVEDRRQRIEAAREALFDPLDPDPHGDRV